MYIITHKAFALPIRAEGYRTLLVGACKGHVFGDCFDDTGDNISGKNPNYCELTGLYWLWKNCRDSFIGIVHYRRYFTHSYSGKTALTNQEVEKLLGKYDVVLPFHAAYRETIGEDYCALSGKREDLERVRRIIQELHPAYLADYDRIMNGHTCHLYNMMILSKDRFDAYCAWLFSILFALEPEVHLEEYNDYQKRIYGFLGERLLNVWVLHNRLRVSEVGVLPTEVRRGPLTKFLTGCKRAVLYRFL